MKIVSTPMCEDVLRLAGVNEFDVNSDPDSTDSDIAIVLSETHTNMKSVKVKLNTFSQIKDSVGMLREMFDTYNVEYDHQDYVFREFNRSVNRKVKVKVYSNFLKDVVEDMGYTVVTGNEKHDYLVFPDYIRDDIQEELESMGENSVEVASHKNCPLNPVKRAELRYKLLEKKLCMKH